MQNHTTSRRKKDKERGMGVSHPSTPGIEIIVATWLDDLRADHSQRTGLRYRSILTRFLRWYLGETGTSLTLGDLNPILLVSYRHALQQTARPATVNTHVAALRTWGHWLVDHHYLDENPAARFKAVKRTEEQTAPKALSSKQVNALIRETHQNRYAARDYAIVQMLVQTGMRIGECVALCWEDLHVGEKAGEAFIRAGKGNRSRSVPLNGSVRQALAAYAAPYLATEPTLKAVAAAWPRPQPAGVRHPFWPSQKGQLTLTSMDRLIKDLIRSCAERNLLPAETTVHCLRHTFATRYLATHPGDLVSLAHLLGHSSLDTTRRYVQPTAEQLARQVERLDLNAYELDGD